MGNAELQTVLVIEDDENQLDFMSAFLERLNYRPVCVQSAEQALEVIARERVDLVLCDVMMPIHGGKWFLERLRAGSAHSNLPVIFLTAAREDTEEELTAAGANDFCLKRNILKELPGMLRRILAPAAAGKE